MKIKHSQMGFYIKVSSLFIVMVVVGFLVFFVNIQNAVKENSQKSMITNVSRQRNGRGRRIAFRKKSE